MKKASDRILKRSVLSVLVAATLHIPQTMAEFTETVTAGSIVRDETVENGTQTVWNGGKTENITIEQGGVQNVSGTAKDTTINNGGVQTVYSGGSATNTAINAGGLMQNAGEDTGTTVKSGGVYELGRIVYGGRNDYFGTSSASDLTVDAGGRATVYAGTLTGATVSGEDATLTLMTPQTETKDSDFTLSL
ncbi:TPA: hypothetical protein J6M74_004676, partial [Escherichia coli]|nr:hypothetical protein [Escherichia coli]